MTDSTVMNYASPMSLTSVSAATSTSTANSSSMAAAAAFYQQQAAASAAALASLDPTSSHHHHQPLASAAALANVDTPRYPWMSITGKWDFPFSHHHIALLRKGAERLPASEDVTWPNWEMIEDCGHRNGTIGLLWGHFVGWNDLLYYEFTRCKQCCTLFRSCLLTWPARVSGSDF